MGKTPDWDKPGADNWIEARKALFVIESRVKSGMGGDEAVPFSDRAAAEKFVGDNGGRIVEFGQVPRDYVLASVDRQGAASADEEAGSRRPND
jgi:copper chaperone NosL